MRHEFVRPFVALMGLSFTCAATAQSFSLDDNPFAPSAPGTPAFFPGFGAENPFGLPWAAFPSGLAPSPSLSGFTGADIFSGGPSMPSPFVQVPTGGAFLVSSLSRNTTPSPPGLFGLDPIHLTFSVDRLSIGVFGSGVAAQAALEQQPADIYKSTTLYTPPGAFVGTLVGPTFSGVLPAIFGGTPLSNTLEIDDSFFGLVSGLGSIKDPAGATTPAGFGSHDNIDAYEDQMIGEPPLPGPVVDWTYYTVYPDEALLGGFSSADIRDLAPGSSGPDSLGFPPFATAAFMGLDTLGMDCIDALVMYDLGIPGGVISGGPGAEPFVDYALFSLAPGSPTLAAFGLDPADVFFTDFSGSFAVYAPSASLGLAGVVGVGPGLSDNIDALDVPSPTAAPLPPTCPADLTGDGVVNAADLASLLGSWGICP